MSRRDPGNDAIIAVLVLVAAAIALGPVLDAWPACSAVLAIALVATLIRARRSEAGIAPGRGHARPVVAPQEATTAFRLAHERLRAAVAADPERFALLTLDGDMDALLRREHGELEGDRLVRAAAAALADSVHGTGDGTPRDGADAPASTPPAGTPRTRTPA